MASESRNGVRLKTLFETLFCSDRQEGEAILADVSYSGALLESASRPTMGSSVVVYVCRPDGAKPMELRGKVVRHTPDGFALCYHKPNPDVVRFLDDTAAVESMLPDDVGTRPPIVGVLESESATQSGTGAFQLDEFVDAVLLQDDPVADTLLAEVPIGPKTTPGTDVPPVAQIAVGAPMLLSELDLGHYSISEIEALAQRIPDAIAIKRAEAKQRVLQKINTLARQEGFCLSELLAEQDNEAVAHEPIAPGSGSTSTRHSTRSTTPMHTQDLQRQDVLEAVAKGGIGNMDNRRESSRIRVSFDALYSEGRREGAGQLVDLSYSGARIAGASLTPEVGSNVRIYVFVQPVAPFEITGEVVRHVEGGFALEFKSLSDEARALVDDAAAVVGSQI